MITPSSELTLTKGTSPAGLNEFALSEADTDHIFAHFAPGFAV